MKLLAFLVVATAYIGSAAWAFRDARRRGVNDVIVAAMFGIIGPLSLLPWLLLRPPQKPVVERSEDFSSPDDAIAMASTLDQSGDWEAAISLYRYTAERWPEQMPYAFNCIDEINAKQDMARS